MNIQSENLLLSDTYSNEDLKKLAGIIRNGKDFRIFAGFDFHETALKMLLDDSAKHMYLLYKKDEDKLIGYTGFFKNKDGYEPEIYIDKDERRKGFGYETLSLLCKKILNEGLEHKDGVLSCSTLYASCLQENIPSNALLKKCGFMPVEKDYIEICQLFIDPITDQTFDNQINDYYMNKELLNKTV
ncbi:MAG: GNAT family N-acetyltransferase [Erysipelotrichaceae bacterium]|nr:GNAT family N-acetyltransferase [Erysipelotrichaceae bacterium]